MKTSIIDPGRNAWAVATAKHLAFLIDGAAYFRELATALPLAQEEIWIVGWDFNPDICLTPGEDGGRKLEELLQAQLDSKPDLQIRILVWAMGPIYSGKSFDLFRRKGLFAHERVSIKFDGQHPLWGSHHQKVVVIDDALAFAGGIDLTARRWDDSRHLPHNPLRANPDGSSYEPVHDLQVMVAGEAARQLGEVARRRWERATRKLVPPVQGAIELWPKDRSVDLSNCQVAISLTEPESSRNKALVQSSQLAHDAIARSRQCIYIEAQYLASFGVAEALEKRLADKDGPEIVIVVTRISHGFLEKVVMGNNRDRIIRRLKRGDVRDRLWVMYAVVPDEEGMEQEILVHSKLLIVDDILVRIGSSNLNNRSEGLDTEADLSIEAHRGEQREAIAHLRHRLLAEHMDGEADAIAATFVSCGSLMRTIETHNVNRRGLRHFNVDITRGAIDPITGSGFVDPPAPLRPLNAIRGRVQKFSSRLLGMLF